MLHAEAGETEAIFDLRDGQLCQLYHNGLPLLREKPLPYLWRAPTDNDIQIKQKWLALGLNRLQCRAVRASWTKTAADELVVEGVQVLGAASLPACLRVTTRYTFRAEGLLQVDVRFAPLVEDLPYLPRLGLRFLLDERYEALRWYGYGPQETYPDRREGAPSRPLRGPDPRPTRPLRQAPGKRRQGRLPRGGASGCLWLRLPLPLRGRQAL